MLDYWESIKKRDFEYLNEYLDISDDYIKIAFETTEKIIAECKKVRDNPKKTYDIFFDEEDNFMDDRDYEAYLEYEKNHPKQGKIRHDIDMEMEGPTMLRWIYGLTKINKTYKRANDTVGRILRDFEGDEFEKKEEEEYELFKSLKKEEESQSYLNPSNELDQNPNNHTEQIQKRPLTKSIIGSIASELNAIALKIRNNDEYSESYIKYYDQIEQPNPDENSNFPAILNKPLVYWNGFYIQTYWINYLLDLIKEQKIFHNNKIISDINEISEYIFAYKEGFELGYEKFDSEEIVNKSSVYGSEQLYDEIIGNYLERHKESSSGGFSFHLYAESKDHFNGGNCVFRENGTCSGFMGDQLRHNTCEWCYLYTMPPLQKWKSKGIEGGKYYRAWFIVLANHQRFDEYFKSKNTSFNQQPEKTDFMTPLKYLEFKNDDIIINIQENFFDEDEAKLIYNKLNEIVLALTPLRNSEKLTERVLDAIKELRDGEMRIIQHWLVKAVKDDDTFVRAYNPLAQLENRRASWAIYQVKNISDSELYKLLEEEKNEMLLVPEFENENLEHSIKTEIQNRFDQMGYSDIVSLINNAFFQIEGFMNGDLKDYQYFGFITAFSKLLNETKKTKYYTCDNFKLIIDYRSLLYRIDSDIKGSYYKNHSKEYVIDNKDFLNDCNEIHGLVTDYKDEFNAFEAPDLYEEVHDFTIYDILKNNSISPLIKQTNIDNPPLSNINKNLFNGSKPPEDNTQESEKKQIVADYFSFMLKRDPRKVEKILSQKQYEELVNWVTYFFENDYTLPKIDKPINKINTALGNIVYTFVILFDKLNGKVTRPTELFELITKCFDEFRNHDIENLKKTTRKPQYYKNLTGRD